MFFYLKYISVFWNRVLNIKKEKDDLVGFACYLQNSVLYYNDDFKNQMTLTYSYLYPAKV